MYLTIPVNAESVKYQISGTLKIPDTQYPIFLEIVRYEPDMDTDTDTDIITALLTVICSSYEQVIHVQNYLEDALNL